MLRLRLGKLAIASILLAAAPARAATFTVNSTGDAPDLSPGNGFCSSTLHGSCTFRAAVMETNALPGSDTVNLPAGIYALTIPGAGEDYAATGDLDVTDGLVIQGAGMDASVIDADFIDRALHFYGGGGRILALNDLGIENGYAPEGNGGGVLAANPYTLSNDLFLLAERVRISGNECGSEGGGVYLSYVEANFEASVIANNTARGLADAAWAGGGVFARHADLRLSETTVDDNASTYGGGIATEYSEVAVVASTVSRNVATPYGDGEAGEGGGLLAFNSALTLTNATVSANRALRGGGVGLHPTYSNFVSLSLANATVADNEAEEGAGVYSPTNLPFPSFEARNSIVADNVGADCAIEAPALIESFGGNLDGGTGCGFVHATDMQSTAPLLMALADYGGLTETHDLQRFSPAVDSGLNAGCPAKDQRGYARPFDGTPGGPADCDRGAVERGSAPPPPGCFPVGTAPRSGVAPMLAAALGLVVAGWRRRSR